MKKALCSLFVLISVATFAQDNHTPTPIQLPAQQAPTGEGKINWLTFEDAFAQWQKDPSRKFLIDMYTDWCGWCKVMDKNTFTNPVLADFINKYYYPVKFNAEQRKDIVLGNQKYSFIAQGDGGTHSLAVALMNNQLSYPTTVFLDENMRLIQPVPGYMDPLSYHQLTTYFFMNFHKVEAFDKYKADTYVKIYGTPIKAQAQGN